MGWAPRANWSLIRHWMTECVVCTIVPYLGFTITSHEPLHAFVDMYGVLGLPIRGGGRGQVRGIPKYVSLVLSMGR